jgi:hypothetical protein
MVFFNAQIVYRTRFTAVLAIKGDMQLKLFFMGHARTRLALRFSLQSFAFHCRSPDMVGA